MPPRRFCRYLVLAEDTTAPRRHTTPSRLFRTAKTLFWLSISVLIGLALGQLA